MDISHDHTDVGPEIRFLGSGGLFPRDNGNFWTKKNQKNDKKNRRNRHFATNF
jgi:hypothetical protein